VRVDLAACYRLIRHFGWDDLVLTHNSARVPGRDDQFLINPMGLMFDEITASNLLKIDLEGNLVEESEYQPNRAGFVIHSAIYMGRADVECVIHTHTEADIAVGALEEGLLPLSQWAMRFYNRLGYHDYEGVSLELDERERLQRSLGNHRVLVLRNHGLLATGRNVAEAFSLTYHFERSAEAQLKIQAAAASGAKIVVPRAETCESQAQLFENTLREPRLQGQREWPALLRMLDRIDPGYRN
jgi:ribulose-5-phosphate 4-epimerase/fuculose-1-phosphate aldolase